MKKNGISKYLQHRLEFFSLLLLSALFNALPEKWVYALVRVIGLFVFHVVRLRRGVTLENLRNSFGRELSEAELEKIAESSYINIGMTFTEMLFFQRLLGQIRERMDMTETSLLARTFEKGRGVILVSGHFGNWELNSAGISKIGYPLTVVAKKQSNPLVDAYINRNRQTENLQLVSTGAPAKQVIRALRNREIVGLISDQDAGKNGIFVDFFGRKASTPRGGGELALKYDIPILAMATVRTAPGRYKFLVREVRIHSDDTVETLTQRYTAILEDIIRGHPEQYFWMHRRWKTQPSKPVDGRKGDGTASAEINGGIA
ncbi:MAG: lysophospholipid acyltransferase family protein [Candidatus Latescibacter sp.]|nr:lysophospholipid acyltransferase family protein [Candidatus Latescibacter sp.]